MNDPHISTENADLYALGILGTQERARCDEHVAKCDDCAKMLGESESVIEALEVRAGSVAAPVSLRLARRRPNTWLLTAGLCASIVVAALLLVRVLSLSGSVHTNDDAMVALVHSHFDHAPFFAQSAGAPDAKVMYARDGSWLLVVVDRPSAGLAIEGFDALGHAAEIGTIEPSANPVTDFVRPEYKFVRLELIDARGRSVASAALAYR